MKAHLKRDKGLFLLCIVCVFYLVGMCRPCVSFCLTHYLVYGTVRVASVHLFGRMWNLAIFILFCFISFTYAATLTDGFIRVDLHSWGFRDWQTLKQNTGKCTLWQCSTVIQRIRAQDHTIKLNTTGINTGAYNELSITFKINYYWRLRKKGLIMDGIVKWLR